MDTFLTGLKSAVDTLGPTVLLPIVIFIIALVLGAKAGRAFRAAVTIGVAFIGINLVLGLMLGSIGDVAKAIVTNTGIHRDIVEHRPEGAIGFAGVIAVIEPQFLHRRIDGADEIGVAKMLDVTAEIGCHGFS